MLINLLPHRAMSLAWRRKALAQRWALVGLLALASAAGWHVFAVQALAAQAELGQQLHLEIQQHDAQIKRMAGLETGLSALALHAAALQQLQDQRPQLAGGLQQLMQLPGGMHLTVVKQDSQGVHVQGAAQDRTQVFEWMHELARQNHVLQRPEIIDMSASPGSVTAPLRAGVAFTVRTQFRVAPASAAGGSPPHLGASKGVP